MATADQNQDLPEGCAPLGSLYAYSKAYQARYKPGDHIGGHLAGLRAVVLLDRKQRAEAAAAVTKAKASAPDEVVILYTNHRGVTEVRRITPIGREWFGSSEWHPEPQWLFTAFDMDKEAFRDFARAGVKAWGQEAVDAALAAPAPVVPEQLRRLVDLVEELCDAFDNGASGIGGRQPAAVLKEVGPALDAAKRILATPPSSASIRPDWHMAMFPDEPATPSKPVGDGPEASAPPAGGGAVPEGWQLVPEEASEEMWQAGREADTNHGDSYSAVWDAMLAAAPAAPEPAAGGGGEIVRQKVLALCNSVLGEAYLGKGPEADLAAEIKDTFIPPANASAD